MRWTESFLLILLGAALVLNFACEKSEDDTGNAETGDVGDGDTGDGDGDTGDGDGGTGDGTGDGDTGDGDGDTGDGDTGDGDGDGDTGDGDGDPIMCPEQFPTFSKTCTDTTECAIGFHMVDCCGTQTAIGVATSELGAFQEAEAICESQYPPCGCAPGPTTAEDGNSSLEDPSAIVVECLDGSCMTSVP